MSLGSRPFVRQAADAEAVQLYQLAGMVDVEVVLLGLGGTRRLGRSDNSGDER